MKLAKRTLFVDRANLQELLGLPDGVEIMGVRPSSIEDGWEFLLASAGEVSVGETKVTAFVDGAGLQRRISLDTLQDAEGDIRRDFGFKIPEFKMNTKEDIEQIAQNILERIEKREG